MRRFWETLQSGIMSLYVPFLLCSLGVPRRVTFDLPSSFRILNVNKMIPVLHSSDRSLGVYANQNSATGVMFRRSPVVATQSVGGAILGHVVAVVGFASSSERYVSWLSRERTSKKIPSAVQNTRRCERPVPLLKRPPLVRKVPGPLASVFATCLMCPRLMQSAIALVLARVSIWSSKSARHGFAEQVHRHEFLCPVPGSSLELLTA